MGGGGGAYLEPTRCIYSPGSLHARTNVHTMLVIMCYTIMCSISFYFFFYFIFKFDKRPNDNFNTPTL